MTDVLTKIKNKVAYTVNNFLDDPNAAAYAQQQKEEQSILEEKLTPQQDKPTDTDEDTSTFSIVRFLKKIGNKMVEYTKDYTSIVLSVLFASIIANEMIVYSVPIRVIFFFFILMLCMSLTPVFIIFVLYYGYKLLYSSYVYYYVDKEKQPTIPIFPTIFAFLPVTVYRPESTLTKILLYLFTYPKTNEEIKILKYKMEEYKNLLHKSFEYYQVLQRDSLFKSLLDKMTESLDTMHGDLKEFVAPVTKIEGDATVAANGANATVAPRNNVNTNKPVETAKEKPSETANGANATVNLTNNVNANKSAETAKEKPSETVMEAKPIEPVKPSEPLNTVNAAKPVESSP